MKTRTWILVLFGVVLIAAGVFFWWVYGSKQITPSASTETCNGAIVFKDRNYGGTSACLTAGEYNKSTLLQRGLSDNSISSFKIASGFSITFYSDDNFSGMSLTKNDDVSNLDDLRTTAPIGDRDNAYWGRIISSIKVVSSSTTATTPSTPTATSACITFYDGSNFEGKSACLAVGEYSTSNMAGMNNIIASVKIPSGLKAIVSTEDNFNGFSTTFTTDLKNLDFVSGGGQTKWDDKISSLKVATAPACAIAVYHDANFGGNGACLAVGEYSKASLQANGISADAISSIKINTGFKAIGYDLDNFVSKTSFDTKEFTATATDLKTVSFLNGAGSLSGNWGDRIASIKVLAATTVTPPPADNDDDEDVPSTPTPNDNDSDADSTADADATADATAVATTTGTGSSTTTSTTTTTTSAPAQTGPEMPLVAAGALGLISTLLYFVSRKTK